MWSAPDESRDPAGDRQPPQRGQVWLAAASAASRGLVVIVGAGFARVPGRPVLAAPLLASGTAGPGRIAVGPAEGLHAPAIVDVTAITALDPADLIMAVVALSDAGLASVDGALCDVLGIAAPLTLPAAAANGAVHDVVPQVARDNFPPAPPPPPPLSDAGIPAFAADSLQVHDTPADEVDLGALPDDIPPAPRTPDWLRPGADVRFDDHPIAQIFGRPQPALGGYSGSADTGAGTSPPAAVLPGAAFSAATNSSGPSSPLTPESPRSAARRREAPVGAPTRAAAVMPELLEIVRRRLQRSAPRLEGVLAQAGEEDRSVEWAAAAVRHTGVRGVMQSTLDEIADEMSAVAERYSARS
jgi:hypothetical protein